MGIEVFYDIHFLRLKSDAYPIVKNYFAKMDRQHGIDFIRRFRSDGEFAKIQCSTNFSKKKGLFLSLLNVTVLFKTAEMNRYIKLY
jgi:hypothetical protein